MTKGVELSEYSETFTCLHGLKRKESSINNQKKTKWTKFKSLFMKQPDKSDVEIFEIPFEYCYSFGHPDSINLLDSFVYSTNEDFLLSPWKYVILDKWANQKFFQIPMALIFWGFTACIMLFIIFFEDNMALQYTLIGFIIYFALFESLQIIAYSSFKIKR